MRIRKRKVPFPISSLSPIPITDPLFPRPPPVVQLRLHLEDDADDYYDPRPSDQPTTNGPDSSAEDAAALVAVAATSKRDNKDEELPLSQEAGSCHGMDNNWVREKNICNNNSTRKRSPRNVGSLVENMILRLPAVSSSIEEKAEEKCKAGVKKLAESGKKKRVVSNGKDTERHNGYRMEDNDRKLDAVATSFSTNSGVAAAGKKGRGRSSSAVVMAGSRCSRINGRGWRCSQQTLVGYSLCEHHLGKGRLRSMNHVRSSLAKANYGGDNPTPMKNKAATQMQLSKFGQEFSMESSRSKDEHGERAEKKPATAFMPRKKVKLGVAKARSIKSLLGQQNEVSDHDQLWS